MKRNSLLAISNGSLEENQRLSSSEVFPAAGSLAVSRSVFAAPKTEELTGMRCKCDYPEFAHYPSDGECSCGLHKHHVHCVCGGLAHID